MSDNMKRVLVFIGHPDDEVIGLGGTIRKLANQGIEVTVVMFCNGNEGYTDISMKEKVVKIRDEERKEVAKILGISKYELINYPDFGVEMNEKNYKICMHMIRKYRPDVIFTHLVEEYFPHGALARLSTDAWWEAGWESVSLDLGKPWRAKGLYHYEVIDMIAKPSHIVDITDTFEIKMKAMRAMVSQKEQLKGFFLYLKGLAMVRGTFIGAKYGEAFFASCANPRVIKDVKNLI
ncbi:MAG: PIG-L family deacetylase [Candidatus Firestonebacteria bacterium]